MIEIETLWICLFYSVLKFVLRNLKTYIESARFGAETCLTYHSQLIAEAWILIVENVNCLFKVLRPD